MNYSANWFLGFLVTYPFGVVFLKRIPQVDYGVGTVAAVLIGHIALTTCLKLADLFG